MVFWNFRICYCAQRSTTEPLAQLGKGRQVMVDRQDALGLPLAKPIDEAAIRELAVGLRGELLRLGDERYDAVRLVFNGMVDRRPAVIARCVGVADVMRGVEFARAHGLPCDNLISADVVTADGRLLTASEEEHEDLFWGIRGGGGNFGVVTSFGYQLHPVGRVLGGGLSYPLSKAREVLRFYHEFASECPDELSTTASLGVTPDGNGVVGVSVCYCGPLEEGERVLRPLREFGSPLADNVQPMAYTTLQSAPDAGFPPGRLHYWKSSYLKNLDDDAIEVM